MNEKSELDGFSIKGIGVERIQKIDETFLATRFLTDESTLLYILMPETTISFQSFCNKINLTFLEDINAKFEQTSNQILIPKIVVSSLSSLKESLPKFLQEAITKSNLTDFSGINGKSNLYISNLLQSGQFEIVNNKQQFSTLNWRQNIDKEKDTDNFVVKFDHPFVFIVKSVPLNLILHIGSFSG